MFVPHPYRCINIPRPGCHRNLLPFLTKRQALELFTQKSNYDAKMKIPARFQGRWLAPVLRQGASEPEVLEPISPSLGTDEELLDGYSKTISGVVHQVAPSVVNIRVHQRSEEQRPSRPGP